MTQDIDVGKLAEQINDKADRDLWNTVPNVWNNTLNTSQITNCITEIPQDIKLELNSGTLKLKAGSKIYVPNGANVYNAVTISSDMILPKNSSAKYFIFLKDNGATADTMPVDYCYTGKFQPTITHTYAIWHDTASYKIKWTGDNGSTWVAGYSFPICVIINNTPGTEKASSIEQVFNGFGYIGSTVFALPGVKGLIPNGRNADGSLKSEEFITSKVVTHTWGSETYGTFDLTLKNNNTFAWYPNLLLKSDNYLYNGNTYLGTDKLVIGKFSINSSSDKGKISFLSTKLPFKALDYNDKSVISGWSMPDYSAKVAISFTLNRAWTAPCKCRVMGRSYGGGSPAVYGYINESIPAGGTAPAINGQTHWSFDLEKGDTYTPSVIVGSQEIYYIPFKGVN